MGVDLLISDKVGKQLDKKRHYMIKGSICQEDIAILNVYVSNKQAS